MCAKLGGGYISCFCIKVNVSPSTSHSCVSCAEVSALVSHAVQLEDDGELIRRQMQEKITDLERRLSRDVAASRDVDSLRAELHVAKTKIDQLQTDDTVAQYAHDFDFSSIVSHMHWVHQNFVVPPFIFACSSGVHP